MIFNTDQLHSAIQYKDHRTPEKTHAPIEFTCGRQYGIQLLPESTIVNYFDTELGWRPRFAIESSPTTHFRALRKYVQDRVLDYLTFNRASKPFQDSAVVRERTRQLLVHGTCSSVKGEAHDEWFGPFVGVQLRIWQAGMNGRGEITIRAGNEYEAPGSIEPDAGFMEFTINPIQDEFSPGAEQNAVDAFLVAILNYFECEYRRDDYGNWKSSLKTTESE